MAVATLVAEKELIAVAPTPLLPPLPLVAVVTLSLPPSYFFDFSEDY